MNPLAALPFLFAALPAAAHPGAVPHAEPHGAEIVVGLLLFASLAIVAALRARRG
ncbi:hypothetical protein T8T21_16540 (plasmid) [Limimaricola variabilis]|uniref:hypothetical protein n=1 Tax=Limimaricola variabilis TaxID=1492771 RepID=UPI002AC9972E|nr:hypothetical protein [Limimaricola variabilis]WPY96120.1 hypothetical protein T8T21_16540 [Limimaricola variabilis]